MADRRFHPWAGQLALGRIAEIAGAALPADADPARVFDGVAALADAGPAHVSFLDNRRYLGDLAASNAGAVLIHPSLAARAPATCLALAVRGPYAAYARVAAAFHPAPRGVPGIHPSAVVDPSATLGERVEIGPNAVVMARAKIGAGCRIGPNATLGEAVELGEGCVVGANASISHAIVGREVAIYPGARIGQDGFGFAIEPGGFVKVPQLGIVRIGDRCEIGANTCIDRGSASDTVIGAGTWIDNLVQIGHNVKVGKGCVIVAQVGISGSSELGDQVMLGGQVGLAGHLKIGAGARVAAQSGVHRDVGEGEAVGGSPAVPIKEWQRQSAKLRQLVRRGTDGRSDEGRNEDESK
ncbi:MAG: UDP-3-O-(3-hydroxymyristoyl)glucosamine N-acyltransferase [Tagaea sp.]